MTTTDISFDPALHAYQESDAQIVLDMVLHQQIGTFSALEMAQVAELLPSWISRNIVALTNGRADDTRDWYFPVFTRKAIPTHTRTSNSSSWSGIHHLAEYEASAAVHPLPPLPAVPLSWRVSTIVASAGGLLLLMPPIYPIPSLENGDVGRPCRACGSEGNQHVRECWMDSNDWGRTKSRLRYAESKVPQDWKPLLVCNPLTKTWRELPIENLGFLKWRYDKVLIDMIVDEQANSYTIFMTFRSSFCMCIYTSASNTWACHHYKPLRSPGTGPGMTWRSHIWANAVGRGRLHYAFLQYRLDAPILATLRVFEINLETGEWKPWKEYALRVRVWSILVARFIRRMQGRIVREASEVLRFLALVECMGDMYAVIPTRLDEVITVNNNVSHVRASMDVHRSHEESYEAMPVQFHILGLNCENYMRYGNGVLRIQVPDDRSDVHLRRMSLLEKTDFVYFPYWNWFSCTARGSVIWVTCEDYVLQYDVVSGQSKTQIVRKPRLVDAGVSYRPSFHMKS